MKLSAAVLVLGSTVFVLGCPLNVFDDPYGVNAPYPYDARSPSSDGGREASAKPAPGDDPCVEPWAWGGRGCYRCTPQTNEQLLAACTDAHFEVFDNRARIGGFDASAPRPPLPPPGPALPPYGETSPDAAPPPPPAPACPLASKPNPVLVLGATGFPLEAIAKAMGDVATIFYAERSSCDGVASMILGEPKLRGEIAYYDTDGARHRCTLDGDHPADVALSALFAETCANESGLAQPVHLPDGIDDHLGPVNTVMFAVPATSRERAISAEAAYKVYGFGAASRVAPWTHEADVFRRRSSSGNQQTVALTLGLPADAFRGRDANGSTNVLRALLEVDVPDRALGISSSEIVDPNRDVLKALAYQHEGQPVAFYPDSDPATLDRKNVRDGHYFMWMPLHILARTRNAEPVAAANAALDGADAGARSTAVRRLVYVMASRQEAPNPGVDLFGALKRTGNVPACAMHVRRMREGAPLEPSTPRVACDCAFDAAHPGSTPDRCQRCSASSECVAHGQVCSFGYCE